MATKLELERDSQSYHARANQVNVAIVSRDWRAALDASVQSLAFLDGMLQYERKYFQRDNPVLATVDAILEYAPIVFQHAPLNAFEQLLDASKRIERDCDRDFRDELNAARELLRRNLKLWDAIAWQQSLPQQASHRALAVWEQYGSIVPDAASPAGYSFVLKFDALYRAKCPYCGTVCQAKKRKLLEDVRCPQCAAITLLVLLGPVHS